MNSSQKMKGRGFISVEAEPRLFKMIRHKDGKDISGTGRVLDGVLLPSGKVVINWRGDNGSISVFDSFQSFLKVHTKPKYNENEFRWVDGFKPSDEINEVFETIYKLVIGFTDMKQKHKGSIIAVLKALQRKYLEIEVTDGGHV